MYARAGLHSWTLVGGFIYPPERRLVHGGGQPAHATNRPTDAVGKSVEAPKPDPLPTFRSVS